MTIQKTRPATHLNTRDTANQRDRENRGTDQNQKSRVPGDEEDTRTRRIEEEEEEEETGTPTNQNTRDTTNETRRETTTPTNTNQPGKRPNTGPDEDPEIDPQRIDPNTTEENPGKQRERERNPETGNNPKR